MRLTSALLFVAAALALIACASGSADNGAGAASVHATAARTYAKTQAAVGLSFDNRGRLIYAEKNAGRIIRVSGGHKSTLAKLAVASGDEPGLLGLVGDSRGDVYAYYTTSQAGCPDPTKGSSSSSIAAHCIWKFKPSHGRLKPAKLIFSAPHPSTANNHVGGGLAFGPDGDLYLGIGDLGENDNPNNGPSRAQSLSVPFGKILRLDPNATNKGASDNPTTCGNADNSAQRQIVDRRIWACGLRNPFSFDWDPSGRLWVAEVGDSCDEIDIVKAGVNYGWQPPRTDCSGAGAGRPVLKVTGTPSGLIVPAKGSWKNRVVFCHFATSSLTVYNPATRKSTNPAFGKGDCGWSMAQRGKYVFMSNGTKITRLRLPGV